MAIGLKIQVSLKFQIMMNFINWNARGIRGKKPELLNVINKYDLFCVTETKLKSLEYMRFPGFSCVRNDRTIRNGIAAGGVMACIRNNIKYEYIKDIYLPPMVEGVGLKVHTNKGMINFVIIYRSPVGSQLIRIKEWNKMFKQFNCSNTIILGDFNSHNVIWNCKFTDVNGSNLHDICSENNFFVVNYDTLTRFGEVNQEPSNIDLVFATGDILSDISYEQLSDSWGSTITRWNSKYGTRSNFIVKSPIGLVVRGRIGRHMRISLEKGLMHL